MCLAAFAAGSALVAAPPKVVWPQEWTVFGPIPPPADDSLSEQNDLPAAGALKSIPTELAVGGRRYQGRKVRMEEGLFDVKRVLGGISPGNTVYLMAPVTAAADATVQIVAGTDWFMQWRVDGQTIYDTLATRNRETPIALSNEVFKISLTQGEHVLAVAVIAGASRELRRAPGLATNYVAKAEALLDFRRSRPAIVKDTNSAALRAKYDQILAAKTNTPQQRLEAQLGIVETYLAENNYPAAREACARARAAASDAGGAAQVQMALARSYLQERKYPDARREFLRLLAMEGLDKELKWEAEALLGAVDLLPRVRTDHPRLFFNAETWPAARERALTAEKELFERIKTKLNGISVEETKTGDWSSPDFGSAQIGIMEAAFAYRVTGDPVMLDKVRHMLRATADNNWDGDSAYPSIRWAAALDWVWNDLPPPERTVLADAMLRYAHGYVNELKAGQAVFHRWLGSWPHYYLASMFGFVGMALLDPEADDFTYARALALVGIGFKQYQDRFASLIKIADDDGVWQTNIEYDFCAVPNAAFPFVYAWQPFTGSEIPKEWVEVIVSPHFALRMIVGMDKNRLKHMNYAGHSNGAWGYGEIYSSGLYDHLGHFMNFFGQVDPQQAAIAGYLRSRMVEAGAGSGEGVYPVFQFLQTDLEKAPPPELPPGLPVARFFESVGLVLMSSGFGPDDTYALFSQGGGVLGRRHDWDATHFSIYKKGYLALDTGVRFAVPHSANYRHQTVAHNAVLIHMPGEKFPYSATGPVIANTGGQNRYPQDARPLAFETDRLYVYTAIDATPVYNTNKCAQMVRQFLYLPPDHFVVFDRVTSKEAEYAKTWLLHTANEPVITGRDPAAAGQGFHADQDQGRIFCRTLLPADAVLEKIGGPGKEFWADGKNWAITDCMQEPGAGNWWKRFGHGYTEPPEAMGRWRVEVKPGRAMKADVFLHLIQTSDQTVEKMVESTVSQTSDRIMLSFTAGPRTYTISLNKTGDVGGHIRIGENGKTLADKALTRDIQPQTGLALEKK